MVVVVGAMRSGTTLVAQVLDSHPEVAYLGFELAEEWSQWTGLPFGAPGADDVECPPLGAAAATPARIRAARSGLSGLLADHVVRTGVRPRTVVLKNPHLWHRLLFVLAVLPRARVVRTRRDLPAVAASLQRLWRRALDQHGRAHHLPDDPDRCWDYVPAAKAGSLESARSFPGGDVAVLVEFVERVDRTLDAFEAEHPDRVVAAVDHRDLVLRFDQTSRELLRALGLKPAPLRPPEPLDPTRLEEWRALLNEDERAVVEHAAQRPMRP